MNFSQLHERLRLEVLRRIDGGRINATLLARQVDCSASHISNFLNRKRGLSIEALDKVLAALSITVADLYPEGRFPSTGAGRAAAALSFDSVPLVEPWVAASSVRVHSDSLLEVVKVRSGLLGGLRDKCSAQRRAWDRFVAVKVPEEESAAMRPLLPQNAIVLIDRHYISTFAHTPGVRGVYAVRLARRLRFRYAASMERNLVLTANNPDCGPELVSLSQGTTSADVLVGRVFLVMIEL